jgi:hypothetical protein
MVTPENHAPLVVISRPSELEGSGWMNVRQAAFHTSCCAATIRKACRACEPLRGGDGELEDGDAATRILSGNQEAHGERPDTDGLVGRIDTNIGRLRGHGALLEVNCVY